MVERKGINLDIIDIDHTKELVRGIPVCIIIPPSPFLADERVFPFLGPLKVAAQLETNGNPVKVLDLAGEANYLNIVADAVSSGDIKHFGITSTTPQLPQAVKIRDIIKRFNPTSTLILGGPHVTLTHTARQSDIAKQTVGRGTKAFEQLESLFDKLVVGDGEEAIFAALDPRFSPQVIDAGNIRSDLFIQKGDLDAYPVPARHLINHGSYNYHIDGKRAFSVIGQLGCPFECGFCGGRDSHVFRIARTRTIQGIISEIESIVKPSMETPDPYQAVMFYDDELNVSKDNLENLCYGLIEMQNRLGMEMNFRGFIKAELFTPRQAALMRQAGFRVVLSGVESGSDRILSAMKKHTSSKINQRCVEFAHTAGLSFKALMSIGHPGESEATIAESVSWIIQNLATGDDVDWSLITQYPGTPYFDQSVFVPEQNAWLYQIKNHKTQEILRLWSSEIDHSKVSDFYKGVPGEYMAYVWTDDLSPQELVGMRDWAESVTRQHLGLPPITHTPLNFDHSMGQGF